MRLLLFTIGVTVASWGEWGGWSTCRGICFEGRRTRERFCLSWNCELGCQEEPCSYSQAESCSLDPCAWTTWTVWSTCSEQCGGGVQQRRRKCTEYDRPVEQCDGKEKSESLNCNTDECVDYSWGEWSDYSSCDQLCDGGTQTRFKYCYVDGTTEIVDNSNCAGNQPSESLDCNTDSCFSLGEWSDFGECSALCGGGTRERTRPCLDYWTDYSIDYVLIADDDYCEGETSETEPCNTEACVRFSYGEWTEWSECSVNCDRVRTRECKDKFNNDSVVANWLCLDENKEIEDCYIDLCPRTPFRCVFNEWMGYYVSMEETWKRVNVNINNYQECSDYCASSCECKAYLYQEAREFTTTTVQYNSVEEPAIVHISCYWSSSSKVRQSDPETFNSGQFMGLSLFGLRATADSTQEKLPPASAIYDMCETISDDCPAEEPDCDFNIWSSYSVDSESHWEYTTGLYYGIRNYQDCAEFCAVTPECNAFTYREYPGFSPRKECHWSPKTIFSRSVYVNPDDYWIVVFGLNATSDPTHLGLPPASALIETCDIKIDVCHDVDHTTFGKVQYEATKATVYKSINETEKELYTVRNPHSDYHWASDRCARICMDTAGCSSFYVTSECVMIIGESTTCGECDNSDVVHSGRLSDTCSSENAFSNRIGHKVSD